MSLKKILYIEDDHDIQQVTNLLFEINAYDVCACYSGKEAINKASHFNPDLILLDVMMPEMDGIETYARLKQIDEIKPKPVIFMTAKVQKEEIERYLSIGAIGVIQKPFDPMLLLDQIENFYKNFHEEYDHVK